MTIRMQYFLGKLFFCLAAGCLLGLLLLAADPLNWLRVWPDSMADKPVRISGRPNRTERERMRSGSKPPNGTWRQWKRKAVTNDP